MSTASRSTSERFLNEVRQYVAFLEGWFAPERWSSDQPSCPLRSGVPTSAEIAYALLRFGKFHTSNWEQWKRKGFLEMDSAIDNALYQTMRMLKERSKAQSAKDDRRTASEHSDGTGSRAAALGELSGGALSFMDDPLLHAIAVHVYKVNDNSAALFPFDRIAAASRSGKLGRQPAP
jgi:hypothetical protein